MIINLIDAVSHCYTETNIHFLIFRGTKANISFTFNRLGEAQNKQVGPKLCISVLELHIRN